MRKVLAIARANWLTMLSYRVQTFISFMGLFVAIVPLYFISRALQNTMAGVIEGEATDYFGFLMVGLVTFSFVRTAVGAVHKALSGEISTGSFEALISTPTSLPVLLAGMASQGLTMNVIRAVLILLTASLLGAHLVWSQAPVAVLIMALIIVSYVPFGIAAGALVLAFRTTGPFPNLVIGVSVLLGGVYYPTRAIPPWLEPISDLVPLTYGLRSLRRSLLEGAGVAASASDLSILAGLTLVMLTSSVIAFAWSLRYARQAGTLAQY